MTGGWGAEVAAASPPACIGYLEAPIKRCRQPRTCPAPAAPTLEGAILPQVATIVAVVSDLLV